MKLLKFSASWCGPCQTYAPIFDKVVADRDIEVERVDVDERFDMADAFEVVSVPFTVLLDDDDRVIRSKSGLMNEEQLAAFIDGE